MDLNTSNVRSLATLSDEEFSKIVYSIALAMGLTPERARDATKNTAFFRMLLSNASDSELQNLLKKVDNDKLAQIYKSISPEEKV